MTTAQHIESVGSRHYFVVQSRSCMPNSCWGRYSHSAVVAVDGEYREPAAIRDTRAQSVLWDSGPGFDGSPMRCAAAKAYENALDLARTYARNRRARLAAEADKAVAEALAKRSGEDL